MRSSWRGGKDREDRRKHRGPKSEGPAAEGGGTKIHAEVSGSRGGAVLGVAGSGGGRSGIHHTVAELVGHREGERCAMTNLRSQPDSGPTSVVCVTWEAHQASRWEQREGNCCPRKKPGFR